MLGDNNNILLLIITMVAQLNILKNTRAGMGSLVVECLGFNLQDQKRNKQKENKPKTTRLYTLSG